MLRLVCIFLFFLSTLNGQTQSTDELLLKLDQLLEELDNQENNGAVWPLRPGWIDNIEFRTETDEFDFDQQRYTLRLSPITGTRRDKQFRVLQAMKAEGIQGFKEVLAGRKEETYHTILDFLFLNDSRILQDRLELILSDQSLVLEKQTQQPGFDFTDLLEIKNDLSKEKLSTLQQKNKGKDLIEKLSLLGIEIQEDKSYTSQGILTLKEIEFRLMSIVPQSIVDNHPSQDEFNYRQEILQRELAMEKADNAQILDFVQLEYRGPSLLTASERWRIGVGLQLPFGKNQQFDVLKSKLENQLENLEHSLEMQTMKSKIVDRQKSIQRNIQEYRLVADHQETEKEEYNALLKTYVQKEGVSPLLQLKIKEKETRNEIILTRMKHNIYEDYIDFLGDFGLLYKTVERNYLSP